VVSGSGVCTPVTSSAATLTVIADTVPPTLRYSFIETNSTNLVLVFSEPILTNNLVDVPGNFILVDTNTATTVTIDEAVAPNSTTLILRFFTPLDRSHGYHITLSFVTDTCAGNVLPDTEYPVSHLKEHVIAFDATWKYDINNGDRTGTGWQSVSFDDSLWPSGPGGLGHESDNGATNAGSIGFPGLNAVPIRTHLNYMSNGVVAYFRKTFTLPAPNTTTFQAGIIIRDVVEDGAVYYLNGQELHRTRMPAGNIVFGTLANGAGEPQGISGPFLLPATHLVAGTNVLAVATHQSSATSSDLQFSVDLSLVLNQRVPDDIKLTIVNNGDGTVTISWNGGGTLQESTNLNSPANWVDVAGSPTSPYTTAHSGTKFYRVEP
jgi:hypothetical protein